MTTQSIIAALLQLTADTEEAILDSLDTLTDAADTGKMYKYVAASSTSFALETTVSAIGDEISHILLVPTTTSPGAVTIKDGTSGSSMTVFTGGTTTINPISLPIRCKSFNGGWTITTGANVIAFVSGQFS